jgi:hypothetical protein
VLNSPEARANPNIVQNTLSHIQEHINFAKSIDPALAAMLKQQSFAPAPIPQAPEQGQMSDVMNAQNPVTQQAEQVNLPQPAESPLPMQ